MSAPNKICRVTVSEIDGANVLVREDGKAWPECRYIRADPLGDPNVPWLWDGPSPEPELDPAP